MKKIAQLPLMVQLPDDETFDSYQGMVNSTAISQLKAFISQSAGSPHGFYIFGAASTGKSHLLHACSSLAAQQGKSSVCLSCSELTDLPVGVLEGLETIDFICLDDVHLIAGNKKWQQAIFDLYNRVLEENNHMVITGNESVQKLTIELPDLVSRLSWGLTEQVKPLDDNEKVLALQYRASQRGLLLSAEAANFMVNRLDRNMASLITALDTLDKASIQEQRKITIPFIKQVFELDFSNSI